MKLQNIFFMGLVLMGGAISGFFLLRAASALYDYATLKTTAPASIRRWEIKETEGKFPVTAYYSFSANGKVWEGAARLDEPWYLNEPSAIASLKQKSKENWIVWFNSKNPGKSKLDRNFPLNLLIRSLVCLGVFFYFLLLFIRFQRSNSS